MSKYKAILTTAGAAKIAAASAGGKPLKIDRLAVGDGNGKLPTPSPTQTKLINERYRAALNSLTVDKAAPDRLIAELIIPASVGGFWLREMGLYDADGVLIAVSNMAESYKPKLEEGSGRTQTLRMVLIVSHTEAITLIVNGDMVTATRDFVAAAIDDHAKSRNHPNATTAAKGFVQLSSVTNSASETLAATPKAVKAVNDAAVKLTQNLADLPDKAKARASLGLKSAALCETGEAAGQVLTANKAFGLGLGQPNLRHRLTDLAGANAFTGFTWTNSDDPDGPPFTGTAGVINHAWRASSTGDPYTLQVGWRDGRMAFRTKESNRDFLGWSELLHTGNGYTAAQSDGKYALRSIKVNGKPLSADVNLLAGDVNAWNKSEADGRYLMLSGGTVKKLTVKTGSTGTENIAMLIDGVEHTPFVLKRSTATANLSIGFQLGGGAPLYRLGINDKNNLCWGTEANQAANATIYHTKNKPTAADVGALTDAQALQKYALRSIKVNGKPLSADVNLVAADINAWNKTESDSRYLMKSGGQLTGTVKTSAEIQSTKADNYRQVYGDYGTFWRNDGNSLYLLMTKAKDQYGTFNALRPFSVDVKAGHVSFGHNVAVNGLLRANKNISVGEDLFVDRNAIVSGSLTVGKSTHSSDGNILGSRWGNKWLWDAVIEQVNGRVDWNSFNNRTHVAGDRNAWWYKDELTGFIIQGGVVNRVDYVNLPMSDIERVADVMTKGFTSSNTNLIELGEAMKYAAPIAEAAGASIEDTTAMLGILADNGIKASMAGTGTSAIFSRLQAPRGQSPAALGELGVKTRDGKGNMLPVEKILKSIHASFKKNNLGTAQQAEYLKVIFGEEAMKGAVKLVAAAGNGKLAEKRAAIQESKGTTDRVAKVQTDNLDGDLKNLQSAWEDVQIEVFEKQDSALRQLTRSATEWLTTVGKWTKANPELTKKIFMVTTAILGVIGVLGGIGLVAWPVIAGINGIVAAAGLMSTIFSAAGGAIIAVLGAISLPVVALAAAFVAAALLIRKYWEPISAFFSGVIIGISEAFAPIAVLFTPLKPMFDYLGCKLKEVWQWFTNLLKPVKSSQESLDSCKNAGVEFGRRLADALMLPLKAFNKLREGIKWVLEKLGVINSESSDIDKKAQKANDYAAGASRGGYYPVGGAMPGTYVPVSAGGGKSYTDNSVNNFHVASGHPGGMTEAQTKRMLLQVVEERERKARAAQRSTLASD